MEGSIFIAGSSIQFLRDKFKFFEKAKEAEEKLRVELERLKVELTGSAAEKEAMLEEKAREERDRLRRRVEKYGHATVNGEFKGK